MKFEAVIFDFDGTVADTGRGVKNAIKHALNTYNIPVGDEAGLDYFIGPPLYEGFEHVYGLTPEFASRLVDEYRVYYSEKGVYECDLYPGLMEFLKKLKESGVKLAVASSKPKHFLDTVVSFIGADKYFDFVIGPELTNHNANKTTLILSACEALGVSPSKKVAMIGDRFYDIEGASGAGVTSVGITFGYGSYEELSEHGADIIVSSVEELKKAVL